MSAPGNKPLDLDLLQARLGVRFNDVSILGNALTHRSYSHRKKPGDDNERLEFFGDAVLKLLVSEYLFEKLPTHTEGNLTKIRSRIVSDRNLAQLASQVGLGNYIRMSFSERNTGGATRESNLANAFEALLAAIYLDLGLPDVRLFLIPLIEPLLHEYTAEASDAKSTLQEWMQQRRLGLPVYSVVNEEGPDHQKIFCVEVQVSVNGTLLAGQGRGLSKKDAEQVAAQSILTDVIRQFS
jgi:ribonuclease III